MNNTATTQPLELADVERLRNFISPQQLRAMYSLANGKEGPHFCMLIAKAAQTIKTMPKTYEQDGKGDEAVVYLHYFHGGADWYITEKDMIEDEQQQAFGYVNLGDPQNAELGYVSIAKLIGLNVELDLYWTPKPLKLIKQSIGRA